MGGSHYSIFNIQYSLLCIHYSSSTQGVYLGAARGEVCGNKGHNDDEQLGEGESVVVVVEEDAHSNVEQYAHHNAHDQCLQDFVFGYEVEVAQRAKGCHDGEKCQQAKRFPKTVAVVHKEADKHQGDGNVVQDDAVQQPLMDVAVGVHHGHAFEEGVDAEADDKARDRVYGGVVAVPGMVLVLVVVFVRFLFLFAAGTVVVAVFGTFGELLEHYLDEEAHHYGGGHFEMDAGGYKTIGLVAEKHVRDQVDEARGKEKRAPKDGDVVHSFGADVTTSGNECGPNKDAHDDEGVGEYNRC